jgi:hypothetical protein
MKKEIKEYLESLENKFETNENYYQAYKMIGSKIIDLGIASTQKGLNELISDSIDEMIKEEVVNIIKISYGVYIKKYMVGPLSITCSVVPLIKGKLSKKNTKTNTVFYTEKELETYKLKKGDFKLIVKGLLNESIESNPFKKYTREDLENI